MVRRRGRAAYVERALAARESALEQHRLRCAPEQGEYAPIRGLVVISVASSMGRRNTSITPLHRVSNARALRGRLLRWCAIGRRPQEVTCAGLFRMFTEATVPSCSVCEEDTTSGVNTRVRVLADDLTSNPADLPRSRKQATQPETKMKPGPAGGRRGHHFRRSANDRCTLWQRLLQARWSG